MKSSCSTPWTLLGELEGGKAFQVRLQRARGRSAPVEDSSAPVEDSSAPVEDSSAPVEDSSAPVDDSSTPVDDSSAPVDDSSAPVDDSSAPSDHSSVSVVSCVWAHRSACRRRPLAAPVAKRGASLDHRQ